MILLTQHSALDLMQEYRSGLIGWSFNVLPARKFQDD